MLLVGYFEGFVSQRGIAWRCSDSFSLRVFLGVSFEEATPDHSSLTKIRQRLPLDVHEDVFAFVMGVAQQKKLLRGKTVAIDSTTLEANAAMWSIVRKNTGEDYKAYLNLAVLIRKLFGVGKPRTLKGAGELNKSLPAGKVFPAEDRAFFQREAA